MLLESNSRSGTWCTLRPSKAVVLVSIFLLWSPSLNIALKTFNMFGAVACFLLVASLSVFLSFAPGTFGSLIPSLEVVNSMCALLFLMNILPSDIWWVF